jgi:hypothetical protein
VKNITSHWQASATLEKIRDNLKIRYAQMFDMYTGHINGFSLPIQFYASSPNSSLDKRIQNEAHTAFTFSNIEQAIIDEDIIMPLNGTFAGYKYAMPGF